MKLRLLIVGLLAVTGLAFNFEHAAVYDRFDQVTSTPLPTHTRIDVRPETTVQWQPITFNGGDWVAGAGVATETTLIDADHKIVIDSGVSNNIRIQADIERNSSDQYLGLVALSDGTDQNNLFLWHHGGGAAWTLARRYNGSFGTLATASESWPVGQSRTVAITIEDEHITVTSDSVGGNPVIRINTTYDDSILQTDDNTWHGLFSRDGSSPSSWDNFSIIYNSPPEEIMPPDFTPFIYVAGMFLGVVIMGLGESRRSGQYVIAGSLLLVASTVPTGLGWLSAISAAVFLVAVYRGYRHIVEANQEGGIE